MITQQMIRTCPVAIVRMNETHHLFSTALGENIGVRTPVEVTIGRILTKDLIVGDP